MIEQHKPTTPVSQLRPIELPPEQPIDVGRYANALRRSKLLIAAIVIAVTGIVLLMSLALPYTKPRCGMLRAFYSNRRTDPSAQTRRFSNRTRSWPAVSRASAWMHEVHEDPRLELLA